MKNSIASILGIFKGKNKTNWTASDAEVAFCPA